MPAAPHIMGQPTVDAHLLFGRFALHPHRRLLLEAGEPVRVGSRALELLGALVERSGEVVSRDELIARVWPDTVGEVIAAQAHPAAERDGVVTVTCSSSVWAQELTLMGPDLTGRLNGALGAEIVRELRFRAAPAGDWAKGTSP